MHLYVMFPLFLENRKSIPKFLCDQKKKKKKKKCNPADFKFYLGNVINKIWGKG